MTDHAHPSLVENEASENQGCGLECIGRSEPDVRACRFSGNQLCGVQAFQEGRPTLTGAQSEGKGLGDWEVPRSILRT